MTIHSAKKSSRNIARWLFFVMILVVVMIVLGGATRLTNSGLSITEWKPITGALPPLTHDHWVAEFEKYKQIPEFMAEHPGMDLKGFEFIYFMEWSHRQLGRLIGLAYALPFLYFAIRCRLPRGKTFRFTAVLLLIGLQGVVGWWMVASGLTHGRVDVSQYRLAAHLGMAFIILALLYWTWRDQKEEWSFRMSNPVFSLAAPTLAGLVYLQVLAGAFVAGTHSGKAYNTWPLMDGGFVPSGYGAREPFWRNVFENTAAIQFNHRVLAYIIVAMAIWMFMRARKSGQLKAQTGLLLALLVWQVGLGIWTLLAVAPLNLSLLHQFSSILAFLAAIGLMRASRRGH
ncbi:MAG: COX15/CtaA family protein [Alphaproteobacteria bacterium]